jgi:hypothetical protein
MKGADRSQWPLTPSQQELYGLIQKRLTSIRGKHRPFLLTGDVGVGKTFLALRLAEQTTGYHNIAQDHLPCLLADYSLSSLTPEACVRYIKALVNETEAPYAVADGFEPLLSLWTVEYSQVVPNFFVALGRAILNRPLLVVIQTSDKHLPYGIFRKDELWPAERRFRLNLTQADKAVVARTWKMDPMRGHISANLYELLATKLER